MALTERLALLITADGAGAIKEMQKVGAAAEKELGKTEDRSRRIGSQFQATGIAMIGAGALITGAMFKTAEAASEAEKEHLKLDNTLANAPKLAGANKQAFLDQATALQNLTVVDDEAVIGAQALLGQFDLTQKQILDVTPLVVDLAEKMGVDLDTAAKAVGKTLDGNAGALKKMGITVDETAYANDHFGATMTALQQKVGGFAESEGKTFEGQLKILKNQLHDVEEGIGVGAVQAFQKLAGPVQSVSHWFTQLSPATQSSIGSVAAFSGVALIAAGGASTLIGSVIKMKDNFGTAASGVKGFVQSLGTVDGAIKGISFAAAAAGVYLLTQRLQENKSEADKWVGSLDLNKGTVPEQIAAVSAELDKQRAILQQYPSLDVAGRHLFGSNEAREQADKVDALQANLDKLNGMQKEAANSADLQARGLDAMGNSIDGADAGTKQLTEHQKEMQDALGGDADAIAKVRDEFTRAADAVSHFNEIQVGQVDSTRDLAQKENDLWESLQANGIAFDNSTQKGRDHTKAFEDAAQAAVAWGADQIKAGADVNQTTAAVQAHIQHMRDQQVQYGVNAGAVDGFIAKLKLTPSDIQTAFHTPGLADAKTNVDNLAGSVAWLAQKLSELTQAQKDNPIIAAAIKQAQAANQAAGGSASVPSFDSGGVVPGPVGTPVPAIVHAGEVVLTPEQQAQMLGGGPQAFEVHVYLDGEEMTAHQIRTSARVA